MNLIMNLQINLKKNKKINSDKTPANVMTFTVFMSGT